MSAPDAVIPIILFAYARPEHLARALSCLRENKVPLIYAFADGAKGGTDAGAVAQTRVLLRKIDWCEVRLTERPANLGLGRNVLSGVTEVAAQHEAFIVWEDDLICVPGTYEWLCAALRHYATDGKVMSVSAWTHPELVPSTATEGAYLDQRAEGWVWGTYARVWIGMDEPARSKASASLLRPSQMGADLPLTIVDEFRRAVWSARWLCHHLQHDGFCVRPVRSFVEHIGAGVLASNVRGEALWANPPLDYTAVLPGTWPALPVEEECLSLWRSAVWRRLPWRQRLRSLVLRVMYRL